jgi:hypothetical protein
VIVAEAEGSGLSEAAVVEVHAAWDGELVLRFTLDRPVREALRLPDGTPVSGRLRAALYLDTDDDRRSGLLHGALDLRTGAERRLEIGAVMLGEDPDEKRRASAMVAVTLHALTPDGRRRTLWRADDESSPQAVSTHGDCVEVRVPAEKVGASSGALRLVLATGDRTFDGRLTAEKRRRP